MDKSTPTPNVGRPAQGFTTGRAQKWILTSAIITGVIYMFRRLVYEGGTVKQAATAARVAGHGNPPPPLSQWATAWIGGYLLLAVLAVGAPEIAGSFAILALAGDLLTNGIGIVADLAQLEGKGIGTPISPAAAATKQLGASALPSGPAVTLGGDALSSGAVTNLGAGALGGATG
jgi:hypothetical protein